MPSVRPRISWLPAADLSHVPACSDRSLSTSRRASRMISAIAISTTLRVLEYGALNTATPAAEAAARSIWLVPMQNAPTAARPGRRRSTSAVTWVFDRMPSTSTPSSAVTRSVSSSAPRSDSTSKPAVPSRSAATGSMFSSSRALGTFAGPPPQRDRRWTASRRVSRRGGEALTTGGRRSPLSRHRAATPTPAAGPRPQDHHVDFADLSRPFVIAHRGGAMQVPEHTMEGYRVAVGQGLPVIEQDVSTLADGGLGVMHDGTVDRMTTSSGNVADHTSVSWKQLDIDASVTLGGGWPDGLRPPLFEEVLTEFGDRVLLCAEAKSSDAMGPMMDALDRRGIAPASVLLQSFALADCRLARTRGGDQRGLLHGEPPAPAGCPRRRRRGRDLLRRPRLRRGGRRAPQLGPVRPSGLAA